MRPELENSRRYDSESFDCNEYPGRFGIFHKPPAAMAKNKVDRTAEATAVEKIKQLAVMAMFSDDELLDELVLKGAKRRIACSDLHHRRAEHTKASVLHGQYVATTTGPINSDSVPASFIGL